MRHGSTNMALWSELNIGVTPKNNYFQHPLNEKLKIFVFRYAADMPHLLKLARNHFLDTGFGIRGHRVEKKCIERILSILSINAKDVKVSHNISQYHLDVQGCERQKIVLAAQLFSERTALAIEWYGQKGYLNNFDWKETARVIRLFNDWFDIFNASSMYGKHDGKNAYGINLEKQDDILREMTELMNEMTIGKYKSLITFQKGIIVSNCSLQQFLPYIKEIYSNDYFNVQYIITRRLNQDVLENFFSFIRATGIANDKPTALDFKYRLKRYILGKHSTNLFCNEGVCNVSAEFDLSCFVSPFTIGEATNESDEVLSTIVYVKDELSYFEEELCAE